MRNNSGAFTDATGRLIRFGLGNISKEHNDNMKSSDLIGITTMVVTPEMVGKTIGVFTAFEVKGSDWKPGRDKKREKAQENFINWVRLKGGISSFISSIDEFKNIFMLGER